MAGFGDDLKFAARSLARRPKIAVIAIALLGLGIGATATLVSPLHSLLLAPLPLPQPRQLVVFNGGGVYDPFTNRFPHAEALSPVFSHVAAYWGAGADGAAAVVTPGFFATVGVPPKLGRAFPASRPAADSIIVSYRAWRSQLHANQDLMALALPLAGRSYRVVGVMPPGFDFPDGAEYWLPVQSAPLHPVVIGRLRPGLSLAAAEARLRVLAASHRLGNHRAPRLQPLGEFIAGDRGTLALQLWLVSLLFFLLACTGVAYLLWARAADRQADLQIRAALGASPWRLARLALAEPLWIAAAGGALGLLLAWRGGGLLHAMAPALGHAGPKLVPLSWLCVVALALIAAALCGCGGAWRAAGARLDTSGGGIRPQAGSRRGGRWLANPRQVAQAAQLALAMILLVAAGLLWRSLWAHLHAPLGFNPRGVMLLRVNLPPLPGSAQAVADFQRRRRADPALRPSQAPELMAATRAEGLRNQQFYRRAARALAALPGVAAVGSIQPAPFAKGSGYLTPISATGPSGPVTAGLFRLISPGGFGLLGMRVLAGRGFSDKDVRQAAAASGRNLFKPGGMTGSIEVSAVVNEALARGFWPQLERDARHSRAGARANQSRALGERLWWSSVPCRIVGVVANVRESPKSLHVRPTVYLPYGWNPYGEPFLSFAVRLRPVAAPLFAEQAGAALAALLPGLPPPAVSSLQAQVGHSWAGLRPALRVLGVFALLGLIVAALGVYAGAAEAAAAGAAEMAIRAAMGATPGDIWRLMQGRQLRVLAIALAAGAVGAWLLARGLAHWLFAVSPADSATYLIAAGLLFAAAVLATAGPATRLARGNPAEALRE